MKFTFTKPTFKKEVIQIQTFPEVCLYSCSKNGEKRNFTMSREYYALHFWPFKAKYLESIRITCDECKWSAKFPATFAKKVFRHGIRSNLLIKYTKSKIITSRFLNFWGGLWRIWLLSLGLMLLIGVLRFYNEPIQVSNPKEIAFQDVYNGNNLGELVTIRGTVDYTLALSKEVYVDSESNTLLEKQVYMPLFSQTNPNDFIVIKGGKDDVEKVQSRQNVSNQELLRNQEYTITGRLESISNLTNSHLQIYFNEELPKARLLNAPQVMINSADVKTLSEWGMNFVGTGIFLIFCLLSSIYVQIFIDKKILQR